MQRLIPIYGQQGQHNVLPYYISGGGGMQRWGTQYNRTTPHTYSLTENDPLP